MALQCVTITPLLPAFGSDKFQLRHEDMVVFPFAREWILYLFIDLSSYVHNNALLIAVDNGNPNLFSNNPPAYGVPPMSEDITVAPLGTGAHMTSDFSVVVLCERP